MDRVKTVDSLFVGLETPDNWMEKPRNPCAECGKETKEHHPEERLLEDGVVATIQRRICSSKTCRKISYIKK